MSLLALRVTFLTLFVASATLVLADTVIVLALVAPPPLLLIAVGGTSVARRLFATWSSPRAVPGRLTQRTGPTGRGSLLVAAPPR